MKMKKEYCKPDTWLINLVSPYALLKDSRNPQAGGGQVPGDQEDLSRDSFWGDFDEDLLEDLSKEEINELD